MAGTCAASAAALWLPRANPTFVSATPLHAQALAADATLDRSSPVVAPGSTPIGLPTQLPELELEPAIRDPFHAVQAAAAAPPAAPTAAIAAVHLVQGAVYIAPPPPPPPLDVRFVGWMRAPDGQRMLMLARAEQFLVAQAGLTLESGYRLSSIESDSVRFVHMPSGVAAALAVPPPAFE
jgi:hypothetical protein